ncbi:MAG: DJ-1/PfpI family protein [Caulobacter sp.]|nr:DJ-1/PfpI family protein [Caulobacter sp.]
MAHFRAGPALKPTHLNQFLAAADGGGRFEGISRPRRSPSSSSWRRRRSPARPKPEYDGSIWLLAFAAAFFEDGKPVASICHGPWTIIETGYAAGRRIASWPSLETDLINAGAEWVDQPSVTDGNLTTSRNPDDIPQFNEAMVGLFARERTSEPA